MSASNSNNLISSKFSTYSPPLKASVTRTYTTGLRFEGTSRKNRRTNEQLANTIVCDLQKQIRTKITPDKMDKTLDVVREQKDLSGTKGAAVIAKLFNDRSNLGQVAYVTMLAAAKGTLDREKKIKAFINRLETEPTAAVEWLVFCRSPYLEWSLQYQLTIAYDYARNLIHSARRTVDRYLPEEYQLERSLPRLSTSAILTAIQEYRSLITQQFSLSENKNGELSYRQKTFAKKLALLDQQQLLIAECLTRWLKELNDLNVREKETKNNRSNSRWKALKRLVVDVEELLAIELNKNIKKYSYLSAIRGILVHALLPFFQMGNVVKKLIDQEIICPEHLVARPFREEKKIVNNNENNNTNNKRYTSSKLLPLSLLMGSKYVVGRPGSSTVMTELATTHGSFKISIWSPGKRKSALLATIRFLKKLQQYLDNGALLKLLILRSTDGPSGKLLVDLVFSGQYWMFVSTDFMKNSSFSDNTSFTGNSALGIDVNRVSPFILAFSEDISLPAELLTIMSRYLQLEKVISKLQRCKARWQRIYCKKPSTFIQNRVNKHSRELSFIYTRRKRLLREIHRQCSRLIALAVVHTNVSSLVIEDLGLSVRGTRGSLAKAILSMPDELDVFTRALLLVELFTGKNIPLHAVSPAYTSSGPHVDCPSSPQGRLSRSSSSYDFVRCSTCGLVVNTHINAARVIRDRTFSSPLPD
jgi:hypothetical protein